MTHRPVKTWGVTMQLQELVDDAPGDPPVFSPARLAGVPRATKAQGSNGRARAIQVRP